MTAICAGELTEVYPRFTTAQPVAAKTDNDADVVARAKGGNPSAFEELFHRHERKIYRLALNITGRPEDAEDVLQDAFLGAFEHLGDFRGDSRFCTWLARIAINAGLMRLRKMRGDKSMPIDEAVNERGKTLPREFREWQPDPEQIMAQGELRAILQQAVRTLSPSRRAIFMLRDVEDLSNVETAELLGLPVTTVKTHLHRGRRQLRKELSKTFGRDGGGQRPLSRTTTLPNRECGGDA